MDRLIDALVNAGYIRNIYRENITVTMKSKLELSKIIEELESEDVIIIS